jgi:TrmH family RNA methyltransferase
MPELISSASNPLVKQIRSLHQKKGREETGLFLVEGIHHTGEAIEAGWEIEMLVHAPQLLSSEFGRKLVAEYSRCGGRVATLTKELFVSLTDKDNPQGLLAVAYQRHLSPAQVSQSDFHLGAAVISPQDPGNVGTILRTLDAVGGQALFLLDDGVDPYHPSSVRASMGTIFWKPLIESSFDEFVNWAQFCKIQIIGTSAHADNDFHYITKTESPRILLLGSEQKGLSTEQLSVCDMVVSLPMRGRASSLNLSVAAGVLLYALVEER